MKKGKSRQSRVSSEVFPIPPGTMNLNPKSIVLGIPPLVCTMGRAEIEHAASMLVAYCAYRGEFVPVPPRELGLFIQQQIDSNQEPWTSLNENPFFRPDFLALVESRFARWSAEKGGPIEFTDAGIRALSRYVDAENSEVRNGEKGP